MYSYVLLLRHILSVHMGFPFVKETCLVYITISHLQKCHPLPIPSPGVKTCHGKVLHNSSANQSAQLCQCQAIQDSEEWNKSPYPSIQLPDKTRLVPYLGTWKAGKKKNSSGAAENVQLGCWVRI